MDCKPHLDATLIIIHLLQLSKYLRSKILIYFPIRLIVLHTSALNESLIYHWTIKLSCRNYAIFCQFLLMPVSPFLFYFTLCSLLNWLNQAGQGGSIKFFICLSACLSVLLPLSESLREGHNYFNSKISHKRRQSETEQVVFCHFSNPIFCRSRERIEIPCFRCNPWQLDSNPQPHRTPEADHLRSLQRWQELRKKT